ncbi:hypothetical protein [Bacillus mycoides]|uniref:hypothetical protein n=1 Tax=Bacillus mycoides TaxID=1405 RepID=UPI001C01EC29|nr:hypothetical protein [Bacillus mycoides]QWH54247.1 hypothetical protein EXW44_29915 [Bacillus mycoides]QWJ03628.1 hypothetical protein J5V93_29380 [Bacillus mycoides]
MIKIELNKHIKKEIEELHLKFFNDKQLPKLDKFLKTKNLNNNQSKEEHRFLRFLRKIRKYILLGTPEQHQKLILHIYKNYSGQLRNNIKKSKKKNSKASVLNNELKAVFNYDSFCRSNNLNVWCAYQLLNKINIQVCPYCNRQYITTLYTDGGKTRAQLDHFFDKASYPYLGISLYNLVPSCSVCNTSLKGQEKFLVSTHVHPYIDSFGDKYRFTFELANNIESLITKEGKINIGFRSNKVDPGFEKKAENNNKVFLLEQLYNEHSNIVKETLQKHIWYSDDYAESLLKSYPGIFNNKDEILRMVFNSEIEGNDFNQRPFSKLITDIAKELQIRGWT